MTRKEQLQAIPYPVGQGESEQDKQHYARALEFAEHWQTMPKTPEEAKEMSVSLPRQLKVAYDRGGARWSMLKYVYDKLNEMEAGDSPKPVDEVQSLDSPPKPADDKLPVLATRRLAREP